MKALLIVFLVISILALIPIGVDGGYSGGQLTVNVKLFGLSVNLYPKLIKKLMAKPKKPKKKKKKKEKKPKEEKEKKKLPFDKKDLFPLLKILFKTLGRLKAKSDLHYLRVVYFICADDPYETATQYGYASAALGALTPLIEKAFGCIKEKEIGVRYRFYPFESEFDIWLTASIQLWVPFYVGGALLIDFIKCKNSGKTKHKHTAEEKPKFSKTERAEQNG